MLEGVELQAVFGGFLVVGAVFGAFIMGFGVGFLATRKKPQGSTDPREAFPIGGKLERLERTINEFRTEVLRALATQIKDGASPPIGQKVIPFSGVMPKKESEKSITSSLKKTRQGLFDKLRAVFSSKTQLDENLIEDLKGLLLGADLGVHMVEALMKDIQEEMRSGQRVDEEKLVDLLKSRILKIFSDNEEVGTSFVATETGDRLTVVMMVGVNGVGKTTTCAKIALQYKDSGKKTLLVAADTFRAAAVQQLQEWGKRIDVPVISGTEDAKPSSVVFSAIEKAEKDGFDVVLIDTAGRLHTKSNLMQELQGVKNTINKKIPGAPQEVLLVLDGTTGQNAFSQAREFHEVLGLTGVVVTKLDGTPRGGVVVAIKNELNVPVRYLGVGESVNDLQVFNSQAFVEALFEKSPEVRAA